MTDENELVERCGWLEEAVLAEHGADVVGMIQARAKLDRVSLDEYEQMLLTASDVRLEMEKDVLVGEGKPGVEAMLALHPHLDASDADILRVREEFRRQWAEQHDA